MSTTELDRPPEQSATQDEKQKVTAAFEWFSKVAGVTLGFTYLVGFLVVTRHLSAYGISSFSILHLQYLVAGFWVIAPLLVFAFTHQASQWFAERALTLQSGETTIPLRRRMIAPTVASLPGTLLLTVFAILLSDLLSTELKGTTLIGVWLFYLALSCSTYFMLMSWNGRRTPPWTKSWWMGNIQATSYYAALLISIFLLYVLFFAGRIYPLIPYSLGGGRPLTVVFLIGEQNKPEFLVRDNSGRASIPYKLLATTERTFIIMSRDPHQRSIEFNRDSVSGMVILKESAH